MLITFIWLQHFLWQYLHLHGGKIETTYINMTREKGQNTMLEHLQLHKPKNVLQMWLIIAKEKKTKQQKHKESVLLKRALHLHLFLLHLLLLKLFNFSKYICPRGEVFKRWLHSFLKEDILLLSEASLFQSVSLTVLPITGQSADFKY